MKHFSTNTRFFSIFILLVFIFNSFPVFSKVYFLEADYYQATKNDQKIVVGRGEILSSENAIARIAITDPSIADLQLLNEKEVFVRGRVLGMTTLLVWEKEKPSPSRFELSIIPDIDDLKKRLEKLDIGIMVEYNPPSNTAGSATITENVETPLSSATGTNGEDTSPGNFPDLNVTSEVGDMISGGKIILTGKVKNADVIAKAIQIAGGFIGDTGIMIISQAGGQIVGEDFVTLGAGGMNAFGGRISDSGTAFTTNRTGNINRGVIITTEEGNVVSFLQVEDQPQIAVSVRFYEISRTLSRNLGFNLTVPGRSLVGASVLGGPSVSNVAAANTASLGASAFTAGTGGAAPTFETGELSNFARATGVIHSLGSSATTAIFDPKNGIGLVLQALQDRGEVKSLSEPTLIITNGEPASFLAGGEVPVQSSVITNGGAAQTITYEPFGIKVTFLPTIKEDGRIHLQLVPEIREIDTELSDFVSPAGGTGLRPPAFKTRRSETQVELFSGEAFAISGLLSESNTRSLRKMPGIGDVPIFGSLFRSKAFNRGESEVLIVVAPEIVTPSKRSDSTTDLTLDKGPPEGEFNFLSPMEKPFYMINDEVGPDPKTPISPTRYYGEMDAPDINPARRDWDDSSNDSEEYQDLQKINMQLEDRKEKLLETQLELKDSNDKVGLIQQQIIQTRQDLVNKEAEIKQKANDIVELTNLMETKQNQAKLAPLLFKKDEVQRVYTLLDEKKKEIMQLGADIKRKNAELEEAQYRLNKTNKQVIDTEGKLKNNISDLRNVPSFQKNETQTVVGLENKIDSLSEEASRRESLLLEKENKIALLEKELNEKAKKVKKLDDVFEDKANKMKRIRTSFAKRISEDADIRTLELANSDINENNNKINILERKWIESELDKANEDDKQKTIAEAENRKLELAMQEENKQKVLEAKNAENERIKAEAHRKAELEELAKLEKKQEKELAKQNETQKKQMLVEVRRKERERLEAEKQEKIAAKESEKASKKERQKTEAQKKIEEEQLALQVIKDKENFKVKEEEKRKQILANAKKIEMKRQKAEKQEKISEQKLAIKQAKEANIRRQKEESKEKEMLAEAKRIEIENQKAEKQRQIEAEKLAKKEMQKEQSFKIAEEAREKGVRAEAKKLEKERQRVAKLERIEQEKLAKAEAIKKEEINKHILAKAKKQAQERKIAEEKMIAEGKQLAQKSVKNGNQLKIEEEDKRKQMLVEAKRIEAEKRNQEKLMKQAQQKLAKETAKKEKEFKKLQQKQRKETLAKEKEQKNKEQAAESENIDEKLSSNVQRGSEFGDNKKTQELISSNVQAQNKGIVAKYHTVQNGESLITIASSYYGNTSSANIKKILQANHLPSADAIYDGKKLLIPVK